MCFVFRTVEVQWCRCGVKTVVVVHVARVHHIYEVVYLVSCSDW